LGRVAILWFGTAYLGWHAIRKRELSKHKNWMLINYSLTLQSAVFLDQLSTSARVRRCPVWC